MQQRTIIKTRKVHKDSKITATQTRGWALDRVHSSRWPCGAVSLSGVTAEREGAAWLPRRDFFALFDPVTLTFDL